MIPRISELLKALYPTYNPLVAVKVDGWKIVKGSAYASQFLNKYPQFADCEARWFMENEILVLVIEDKNKIN